MPQTNPQSGRKSQRTTNDGTNDGNSLENNCLTEEKISTTIICKTKFGDLFRRNRKNQSSFNKKRPVASVSGFHILPASRVVMNGSDFVGTTQQNQFFVN